MWQIIDYPLPLRLPCWLAAALSVLSPRLQVLIVLLSPCLLIVLLLSLLRHRHPLRHLIYLIRRWIMQLLILLLKSQRF